MMDAVPEHISPLSRISSLQKVASLQRVSSLSKVDSFLDIPDHSINTPLELEENMLPMEDMMQGHLEELLDTDPTVVMQKMLKSQIRTRTEIAHLYGVLLDATPPTPQVVNASHNWNLAHIEAVTSDLRVNLPNNLPPLSIYSKYFVDAGLDPRKIDEITEKLISAIAKHREITTKIEQYGKGVV